MTTAIAILGGTVIVLLLLLGVTINALQVTARELREYAPLMPIEIEEQDTIQEEDDGRAVLYQRLFDGESEEET